MAIAAKQKGVRNSGALLFYSGLNPPPGEASMRVVGPSAQA
jgi:hypothetical protein